MIAYATKEAGTTWIGITDAIAGLRVQKGEIGVGSVKARAAAGGMRGRNTGTTVEACNLGLRNLDGSGLDRSHSPF
jgi:hypothetical protein